VVVPIAGAARIAECEALRPILRAACAVRRSDGACAQAERSAGSVYSLVVLVVGVLENGSLTDIVDGRDDFSSLVHWRAFVVTMERRCGP
jgi:hypothetical protein